MKCSAKNASVMGKINPLSRPPSLLISCFLANSISLILKKSRGLYFKNTDSAVGKVIAAISSSSCQGRVWHQKPRGFLNCFTNALKTESPYCIRRRKITKVGNFPSLIYLMNWKIKAIVNENYCLVFFFFFFLSVLHHACLVHVSYILPGSREERAGRLLNYDHTTLWFLF